MKGKKWQTKAFKDNYFFFWEKYLRVGIESLRVGILSLELKISIGFVRKKLLIEYYVLFYKSRESWFLILLTALRSMQEINVKQVCTLMNIRVDNFSISTCNTAIQCMKYILTFLCEQFWNAYFPFSQGSWWKK